MKILKNDEYKKLLKAAEHVNEFRTLKQMYEDTILRQTEKINLLSAKLTQKEEARRKLAGKIGGLQREINKLKSNILDR